VRLAGCAPARPSRESLVKMTDADELRIALRDGVGHALCRTWLVSYMNPILQDDLTSQAGAPRLPRVARRKVLEVVTEGPARAMYRFIGAKRLNAKPNASCWWLTNCLKIPEAWPPRAADGSPVTQRHPTLGGLLLCAMVVRSAVLESSEMNQDKSGCLQVKRGMLSALAKIEHDFTVGAREEERKHRAISTQMRLRKEGTDTTDVLFDAIIERFLTDETLGVAGFEAGARFRDQVRGIVRTAGDGSRSSLMAAITSTALGMPEDDEGDHYEEQGDEEEKEKGKEEEKQKYKKPVGVKTVPPAATEEEDEEDLEDSEDELVARAQMEAFAASGAGLVGAVPSRSRRDPETGEEASKKKQSKEVASDMLHSLLDEATDLDALSRLE